MDLRRSFARITSAVSRPGVRGRLSDFGFAGRLGPVLAFALICAVVYTSAGYGPALKILVKLWTAYSIAFIALACLAKIKGIEAPWIYVLPTAAIGVCVGGFASATIALAPDWSALVDLDKLGPEWVIGAAFSAFFVGLSLATAAVRRREQFVSDTRQQLLEARLKTLTAQIEPHFLMNTLANLRYLIKTDVHSAHAMLDHLADFLQGALERSRDLRSTLGQELQLVESYLSIMQIRLGKRLRFVIDAPAELTSVPFPALLLQTLVENAVAHGIEPSEGNGIVNITARKNGARIVLTVADNGVGLDQTTKSYQGLGLKNADERLTTFYHGRGSLSLAPAEPCGTVATVTIPEENP